MRNFISGVALGYLAGVLASVAVAGTFWHLLNENNWECIVIKPATEVGQTAECVAYRSTEVEWSR